MPPDLITIADLEVLFHVGVPDAERAQPQRLLVSVEMATDFTAAAAHDNIAATIDYHAVTRRLRALGEGRSWRLIETLADEMAAVVLREFGPQRVRIEIKKFILPETRHVSVTVVRGQ